ncbi:conserved hypothetical protein [Polaromonas naphthalenivorans CJ2]|uniref:Uncharacterized protein n=2 Tax=Polaromonas naphthalenivorans TaxID=216465 RepID=A1VQM7_POLNA|nr:conserved hypothetical protein [Polaromonas naphthalenivorans CJ2]
MNWLARLKKTQMPPNMDATNATETLFVVSVASIPAHIQKTEALSPAANDPAQVVGLVAVDEVTALVTPQPAAMPDPDRWCWPHSSAMTGREIDTMVERTALFNRRGLAALEAELLADKLVTRDRDGDERRLCLECAHLSGRAGAMRCAQWQRAGLGAPGVPAGLQLVLQRCDGFKAAL